MLLIAGGVSRRKNRRRWIALGAVFIVVVALGTLLFLPLPSPPSEETRRLVIPNDTKPYEIVPVTGLESQTFNYTRNLGVTSRSGPMVSEEGVFLDYLWSHHIMEGFVGGFYRSMRSVFHLKNGRTIEQLEPQISVDVRVYEYENESMARKAYEVRGGEIIKQGVRMLPGTLLGGRFIISINCGAPREVCDDIVDRIADKYGQPIASPRAS